jgi:hypothetical protein
MSVVFSPVAACAHIHHLYSVHHKRGQLATFHIESGDDYTIALSKYTDEQSEYIVTVPLSEKETSRGFMRLLLRRSMSDSEIRCSK